jgi:hypothetical protein
MKRFQSSWPFRNIADLVNKDTLNHIPENKYFYDNNDTVNFSVAHNVMKQ